MELIIEGIILVGFMYWAFPSFFSEVFSRVTKMVDIVSNRIFNNFNRFSPQDNHHADSLASISQLRRFSRETQHRKKFSFKDDHKERENQLFDIKENLVEVEGPKTRPLMGLSCDFCTSISRDSLLNKTTDKFALNNILDHTPSLNRRNSFLERSFCHLYQGARLKRFEYPQVSDIVLRDNRLKDAIEKTTLQQFHDSDSTDDEFYQELLADNKKRAHKLLYGMRSTLSDFLLRFTSWVLYKLLPCFLSCVVAHPGQVNMLKKAAKSGLPMIFLPLHRSHLDYILMSFILLNNNVRAPLVAAGDNLRIPFFGSLLRGLGAFFIKRRIDPIMGRKDHLYKAVLHTYMNECLRAGHNMEFFLEGGRTRTGKPCMPKYGVLSVIVEAFMDGTIEDALLVPVSINCERLVDGNFIREQLGQPKQMETFGAAMRAIWHVLNSDYGMMRIDFNQPFSLRELVKTFDTMKRMPLNGVKKTLKSNPSTNSLYGTDVVCDENKNLVESISKHVIYDCAKSTTIMSTNAVAFILLNKHREGAPIEEIIQSFDGLRSDLGAVKDVGFTGDSIDVIHYAVDLLGPGLIRKEKSNGRDIIKPMAMLPNVIELNYYSNTVTTHYALDSVIAIAINSSVNSGKVSHEDLVESVLDLCNLFQYEFIFCKPCQHLEHVVGGHIDDLLLKHKIFLLEENFDKESVMRSRRIAAQFEDDGEVPAVEQAYVVNQLESALEHLKFLRGILMPLLEAYAITAFTLEKLVGRSLLENELVMEVLAEIQLQLEQGTAKYAEGVSVDTVKNALKLYQKWEILECHTEKKLRLFYLKDNQDNTESIEVLYERVNKYRQSLL